MKAIIICLAILSLLSVSNEKKIRFLAAGLGGMGGLSNACNIVDKICLMWRSICGAFATVKSSYLKEILIKDGFDHYSGTTTLQYSVWVKEDKFERFALRLAGKIGVPESYKKNLASVLLEAADMDTQVWSKFDIIFNNESPTNDQVKYANVLVSREADDSLDVLYSATVATFKLTPDIWIIHESASYAGGIYGTEKDIEIKRPKNLTADQLEAIFKFFQIIGYKIMALAFGTKLEFPKL